MLTVENADEYKCLLGDPSSQCRQPDIILVQSGFHDVINNDFKGTEEAISQVMQQLRDAKKRGSAVYWMATTDYHHLDGGLRELNAVAARMCMEHHPTILYIDRPQSASRFNNEFHDKELMKSLNLFGNPHHHIGAIEFRDHYELKNLILSSYLTQDVLSHICS